MEPGGVQVNDLANKLVISGYRLRFQVPLALLFASAFVGELPASLHLFFSINREAAENYTLPIQLTLLMLGLVGAAVGWRCPVCDKWFPSVKWQKQPRHCRRCGVRLVPEPRPLRWYDDLFGTLRKQAK